MVQRVDSGGRRGLYILTLGRQVGTIDFKKSPDVLYLMAVGFSEEVATSIWHLIATYEVEAQLLALVIDRSEARESVSFVQVAI